MHSDPGSIDIEQLVSNREAFNAFLYTPLDVALAELDARAGNEDIERYLQQLLAGVPQELQGGKHAVLFRNVATPDFDLRRFVQLAEGSTVLDPVVAEYHEDLFTNRNDCKFALGKICFHTGKSKNGDFIFTHRNIIDINDANKKKISEIKTHWGQPLTEFHHELLQTQFLDKISVPVKHFDASAWIQQAGKVPQKYYETFLALFLKNNILFENYLIEGKELEFIKQVILPSFIKVWRESGYKPLIVALQSTDIEGDKFWLSHPGESIGFVESKGLL